MPDDKKICPLFLLSGNCSYTSCLQEQCAWWTQSGDCAVVDIAYKLISPIPVEVICR